MRHIGGGREARIVNLRHGGQKSSGNGSGVRDGHHGWGDAHGELLRAGRTGSEHMGSEHCKVNGSMGSMGSEHRRDPL